MENTEVREVLITDDTVLFGLLLTILGLIFFTSTIKSGFWQKFYSFVPALLLCYFLPSLLNTFGIADPHQSRLYFMASRYLLPAALVLLTISIDFAGLKRLGPKAVIMFFAGTIGIVLGGPIALWLVGQFYPSIVAGDEIWRGMSTIAGSWIGGGANQTAMKEVFKVKPEIFTTMVTVDVLVANIWMAFLLFGAGRSKRVDAIFRADSKAIDEVRARIETYRLSIAKMPTLPDVIKILAVGFGVTSLAHFLANFISSHIETNYPTLAELSLTSQFFWLVVIATTVGLLLSLTKVKKLEGAGASRLGGVMIYILVATIGLEMNVLDIANNPGLFVVGLVWMLVHVTIMLSIAWVVKAPFFFTAVGSQANVGGAASAPVVASAFHESLAPVGVLLAVLGYAVGTYGAYLCGLLMKMVAAGIQIEAVN